MLGLYIISHLKISEETSADSVRSALLKLFQSVEFLDDILIECLSN